MKHFKKIGSILVCVILILTMFVGCTEAGRVKHNVKQDADNIDYINLNEWTTYVIEDLSGAEVNKYHYELNYLPEMVQPFTITSDD